MTEIVFKPSDRAREAFRRMYDSVHDAITEQFFDIFEAEGDWRRAGSMAAQVYIRNAARVAVFGARCAGVEPDADLWRGACNAAFAIALKDVEAVFAEPAINPDAATGQEP